MGERLEQIVTADGRTLAFAQWGDLGGVPVVSLHGTPGSRLGRPPDEDAVRRLGARVVTYDRPGYGRSDRAPGRRVVDCVADVQAIADHLGLESFRVTGVSGGGPHALAMAARMPDRVVRARCSVGLAPLDAEGLDWVAGMDPENVREFGWARQGEEVLHRELDREGRADLARIAVDPSQILSDDWHLDPADRQVLSRADVQQVMGESMREAHRAGTWGWVDDDLAFLRPWGSTVAEIRVPVEVRYGAKDVLVPPAHGAWLAANVPGAHAVVEDDVGHLASPEKMLDLLRELLEDPT
jgi:pimeloyl-ACP methyl ester carboxylesterase